MRHTPASTLIPLLVAMIAFVGGCQTTQPTPPNPTPIFAVSERVHFDTLEDMKHYWDRGRVTYQEGTIDGMRYVVVADDHYSGPPSLDIYCYVENAHSHQWRLRAMAYLGPEFNLKEAWTIKVTQHEKILDVWRAGQVRLSLNVEAFERW
jgi:hypothetical protein